MSFTVVTIYSLVTHLGDALSVTGERLRTSRFLEMGKHLKRGGERDHKFGSVYLGRSISTRFGWIEVAADAIYNLFLLYLDRIMYNQ